MKSLNYEKYAKKILYVHNMLNSHNMHILLYAKYVKYYEEKKYSITCTICK